MSRWRILVVLVLILLPFLALVGLGFYFLWTSGVWLYASLALVACMASGYLLGWYWQRKQLLLRPPDFTVPLYWTDRDRRAWHLVEARAKSGPQVDPEKLTDLDFYVEQGRAMAEEMAIFYNPRAADPIGALTIPEILAVIELVAQDMSQLVDEYLPGGHLLTVNDLRRARTAIDWYPTAVNAYWLVAALFNPVETGVRFAASKFGLSQPLQMLQNNLLLWLYTTYLHRMGTYLVELNSGRLRLGVARYRRLVQGAAATAPPPPPRPGRGPSQRTG